MKALSIISMALLISAGLFGQDKVVLTEKVDAQPLIDLKLSFADEIHIVSWDKNEVYVEATVLINNGENNDLFKLEKFVSSESIRFEMDMDPFEDFGKLQRKNSPCNFEVDITYQIYVPNSVTVKSETIDGSYNLEAVNKEMTLKTISGDIDLFVPGGLEFSAKTISGEIYTDLDIEVPNKEGLSQIVGMDLNGKVAPGGKDYHLETISGNIYLRKSKI